jgi:hypothetical protein
MPGLRRSGARVRERLAFIAGADDMTPLRKMGVIAAGDFKLEHDGRCRDYRPSVLALPAKADDGWSGGW